MSAVAIAAIVFACVFGGALAGFALTAILPEDHLSAASKDVVKVATAMIATLAALVIGLLVASAKGSFDAKETEFTQLASRVILLDRTLAQYGAETGAARGVLRAVALNRLHAIWPDEGGVEDKAIGGSLGRQPDGIEAMQKMLHRLAPQGDEQLYLKAKALQTADEIAAARWLLFEQVRGSLQWPFLAIVVFWLAIIFASFGLSAPRNATVLVALFASALSVAAAMFLIVQLDQPYDGLVRISSAPLRQAIAVLGKP
jgi:hypothetical protein